MVLYNIFQKSFIYSCFIFHKRSGFEKCQHGLINGVIYCITTKESDRQLWTGHNLGIQYVNS